mmetsp:Transcript_6199/g.24139  ORF Transcript_6199/g.24139 Transcript_6199/m.24139 type:complete len:157 (+) Transcript_6199:134-604(+)
MTSGNPITLPVPPLQIGDEIPSFRAETHIGSIQSHDVFDGQYGLLVTFRGDFDPIATTEIGMLSKLHKEFKDRNIFVVGLSADTSTRISSRSCARFLGQSCDADDPVQSLIIADGSRMCRRFRIVPSRFPSSQTSPPRSLACLDLCGPARRTWWMR